MNTDGLKHDPLEDDPRFRDLIAKAEREAREESVSKPGGFKNDPEDPTNPNEAIERHRRKLRP